MEIDVARAIGAVAREVSSREVEGRMARVIVATRVYDTAPADLWDALTNPERIPRWFLPISGDLRPGGRYALEGNASGEIIGCEPPHRLALTWEMHGSVSWVTVDLTDEAQGRTQLRLEHVAHVPPEFWDQYGPGAVGVGWEQALLGLALHTAGEAPVTPEAAQRWVASANGREFMAAGSRAWGEAAVAGGTPADEARAAAERTRAFYTGDPPGE